MGGFGEFTLVKCTHWGWKIRLCNTYCKCKRPCDKICCFKWKTGAEVWCLARPPLFLAAARVWWLFACGRGHAVCRVPSGLHALLHHPVQTADDNQPKLCQQLKRLGFTYGPTPTMPTDWAFVRLLYTVGRPLSRYVSVCFLFGNPGYQ